MVQITMNDALRYLDEPFDKFDIDKQALRLLVKDLLIRVSELEKKDKLTKKGIKK